MEQATLLGHNALTAAVQFYTASMQALANDHNATVKAHEEAVRKGVELQRQLDAAAEESMKALTEALTQLAAAHNEAAEARAQLEAAKGDLVKLYGQLDAMIAGGAETQLRLDKDVPGIGKTGELVQVWMTPAPAEATPAQVETMVGG